MFVVCRLFPSAANSHSSPASTLCKQLSLPSNFFSPTRGNVSFLPVMQWVRVSTCIGLHKRLRFKLERDSVWRFGRNGKSGKGKARGTIYEAIQRGEKCRQELRKHYDKPWIPQLQIVAFLTLLAWVRSTRCGKCHRTPREFERMVPTR